jgi:hypothetical protein
MFVDCTILLSDDDFYVPVLVKDIKNNTWASKLKITVPRNMFIFAKMISIDIRGKGIYFVKNRYGKLGKMKE